MTETTNHNTSNGATKSFDHAIGSLKSAAQELVDVGSGRIGAAKSQVVSTAQGLVMRARAAIVANPFAAVGIAFGIGYIAMRLMRRR
jgi:ElaB/YqjD/DUF883 family membrane-anchored ribosome-binding protein